MYTSKQVFIDLKIGQDRVGKQIMFYQAWEPIPTICFVLIVITILTQLLAAKKGEENRFMMLFLLILVPGIIYINWYLGLHRTSDVLPTPDQNKAEVSNPQTEGSPYQKVEIPLTNFATTTYESSKSEDDSPNSLWNTASNPSQTGEFINPTYPMVVSPETLNQANVNPDTASATPDAQPTIQQPNYLQKQESSNQIGQRSFNAIVPVPASTFPNQQDWDTASTDGLLTKLDQERYRVITRVQGAVVNIEAIMPKKENSSQTVTETGSGILTEYDNRYFVITNRHVAGRATSTNNVKITLADRRVIHPTQILSCRDFDIAVLEIQKLPDIHNENSPVHISYRFGDSDSVQVTNFVLAVGSPFGLKDSISSGIISSCGRNIPLGKESEDQIQDFFQIDAPINPGNSGGPLVNARGEVIGIITATATRSSGIGFAIPINHVLHVAQQLIQDGVYRKPYMGIELDTNFNHQEQTQAGLERPMGTRVLAVKSKSPAERAGLRKNDVILSYDGVEIRDNNHLIQLISFSKIGHQPKIQVLRNHQVYELTPQLIVKTTVAE